MHDGKCSKTSIPNQITNNPRNPDVKVHNKKLPGISPAKAAATEAERKISMKAPFMLSFGVR